jgi:hypothetical protein
VAWGDLRGAYGLLQRAALGGGHDAELSRALRLAACRPVAEWEALVAARLQVGAMRLARLTARDFADFVPGAASSPLVRRLLARVDGELDEKEWLSSLRRALGVAFSEIDAFFAQWSQPTLEHADRLAGEWAAKTPAELVYVLGQALGRYLWMTTQPANPLAGGLRQIVVAALDALDGQEIAPRWREALVEALAVPSAHADPWIADEWLLRVGRAFGEDPRDERDAARAQGGEDACTTWERCLRALGPSEIAAPWARAAATSLPAANALDVLWIAHAAAPTDASIGELLADALDAAGHPAAARDVAIETRAPGALSRAPSFAETESAGLTALAAGNAAEAVPKLRLCEALEPKNPTVLKNLAIACASAGDVTGVVRAFAALDPRTALRLSAQALVQARRFGEAHAVLGVAAAALVTPDEWLLRGGTAWYANDLRSAAEAYSTLATIRPLTEEEERARVSAVAATPPPTPGVRAFQALERGDVAAIKSEAEASPGWSTWRAAIVADPSTASFMLEATVGQQDLDACLLRERALRARAEQTAVQVDLGVPMERDALAAFFARRDEDDEPTLPKLDG